MKNTSSIMIIAALAASLFIFNACHKDDETDKNAPVVNLTAPVENQQYTSGDTIFIKGLATDESMHEMEIKLTDDANSAVLLDTLPEVHDFTSYDINNAFKTSVTAVSNYTLLVTVEDHSSNVTTKTVHVKVNP